MRGGELTGVWPRLVPAAPVGEPESDREIQRVERRAWWAWFGIVLLLCCTWGVATPLFGGPDEGGHVIRAAAISQGHLSGRDVYTAWGWMSEVQVPGTWARLANSAQCFLFQPNKTPRCVRHVQPDPTVRWTLGGNFPRFPPLYYLGMAPIARLFPSRTGVWMMRGLSALVCAAFYASAFVSARRVGSWAVVGVAAAIVPVALYLGGLVNPSGLEIAAAVCLWASAAAIARGPQPGVRLIVRTTVSCFVLANTRGLSLPMSAVALAVPLCLADRARLRELAVSRAARAGAIVLPVGGAAALAWAQLRGRVPVNHWMRTHITVLDGLRRSWRVFGEGIAWFGYLEIRDVLAIVLATAIWAFLLVLGLRAATFRGRAVLLGVVAIALTFPIAVSLLRPPPLYTAWQGRHGLALWIGVPIIAGVLATVKRRTPSVPLVALVAAAICVQHLSALVTAAHHYAVGRSGHILYFIDPRWNGPVPQFLVLATMVFGTALLARGIITATTRPAHTV